MTPNKIHFISGSFIAVFSILHLFNHFCSLFGADKHIEIMSFLRLLYRNIIVESLLLLAILLQILSGLKLLKFFRKTGVSSLHKLHVWSGLYLSFFLIIHVSAVLVGRLILQLDTNFYFAAAGLTTFPFNLFFVPYYALAIFAFFVHFASIHAQKMKNRILILSPKAQANTILLIGVLSATLILWGLTNHFQGVTVPKEYLILIGK